MARYDREFLVPYLEDICALYMCQNVLTVKVFEKTRSVIEIEAKPAFKCPIKPRYIEPWEKGNKIKVFGSVVVFLVSIWIIASDPGYGGTFDRLFRGILNMASGFGLILSPIAFIMGLVSVSSIKRENEEKEEAYIEAYNIYKRRTKALSEEKERQREHLLPQIKADRDRYSKDLEMCERLLQKAYDADVIPTKYRDKYAAMYLYDWFKHNRRADDLDAALNTFVLEQIKERLDKMIIQLEEIIINERIMIANQRISMEEQRHHHERMEKKLQEITDNQEEQMQYLEMIESNTEVSAYFSTMDYLTHK